MKDSETKEVESLEREACFHRIKSITDLQIKISTHAPDSKSSTMTALE